MQRKWLGVVLASLFINTSYGTLSYAFSVLVTKSGPGGEFGAAWVSAGFAAALLVSGLCAIFVGTVADLFGTRRVMAAGALVGAAGLALVGLCREPWQFIVVMLVLNGPAMAATFYEPVYVLMNRWFEPRERGRAYGVLTLLSGFSITIFTPLTRWLVHDLGWRQAVAVLGVILLAVGTLVPLLVREPPQKRGQARPAGPRAFLAESRAGLRQTTAPFWLFTAAFFVATVAFNGYQFHMVAQLETRGFREADVANVIALTGIISLPARLILPMSSGRAPSAILLAICMVMLGAAALVAASAGAWWQVWLYIGVFGVVFGSVYPLRALAVSERFSGPYFGRIIGIQALFVALGRALGPLIMGLAGTDEAGYQLGFRVAGATLLLSAVATWLALRRTAPEPRAFEPLLEDAS